MRGSRTIAGLETAVVVEDYPDFPKGACVLVLEYDQSKQPMHVVGESRPDETPAVMVTALASRVYRLTPVEA